MHGYATGVCPESMHRANRLLVHTIASSISSGKKKALMTIAMMMMAP
jgi:hypothetical protein